LAATVLMSIIPSNGNSVKGINAVTEIETASVIHQMIIHAATAMTVSAFSLMMKPDMARMIRQTIGPAISPIFFAVEWFSILFCFEKLWE